MTEREIDYDKSRVEYEFFDKSTETFSVRLIALPNTEILTCAKKDITTIDKEDSGIIEVFLKDRKFRMGYAGTLPGTRDADIILLDAWCGTGTSGGGGGGDATAANQTIQSHLLTEIRDQQIDGTQKTEVTNFPATQPVSAVSLPLPAGAATSANQTLQITQETAINKVLGTQGDAAAGTDIANASQISLFKRLLQRVTTLITDSATALANWVTLFSRIPAALTAGGNFKVAVQEALPTGANTIGNVGISGSITAQVGGSTYSPCSNITVTNVSTPILPANANRRVLILNSQNSAQYWFDIAGNAAVVNKGLTFAGANAIIILEGSACPKGAINGIRSSGSGVVSVWEGV